MIALKERTIEVVKKYSIRYNIKYITKDIGDLTNKGNFLLENKIQNFSGAFKNVFTNQIFNIKNNVKSLNLSNEINNIDIENKKEKISNKSICENESEKSLSNKEISSKNLSSKIIQSKQSNNNKLKSNSISPHKGSTDFSLNNSDKIYIRKLEMQLEKEKKKRLYYQKLYEELKEKNKYLYSQLLAKSLNLSSMNKSSQLGTEFVSDAKLNKMILNDMKTSNLNINNNIPKKVRTRALSLNFRNLNKLSSNSSGTGSNSPLSFKNKAIKNRLGLEFKERNKSKSITQNYFNITKNINIINKFEKKDNKKKISNINTKTSLSNNNNDYEKVLDINNKIDTQVNNSLSNIKSNNKDSLNLDMKENNSPIKKKKTKTKNNKDKRDSK